MSQRILQPGDRVRRRTTGEVGVVVSVSDGSFCEVVFPEGQLTVPLDEFEPLPSDPAEQLAAGTIGPSIPYALRLQALYLRHAYRFDPLSGLSSARMEPSLHQIYIAHLVTQKIQPRMILADEVGLGKTVEAGLIIKELRARELIERVLVVVPASLQMQWQQELRSKFNEEFEILDGPALSFLGRDGTNPWSKYNNVICSLPLAANPKRADKIVEADWDLVIFDEAHRVRRWLEGRNKPKTTQAYKLADELKELVNGLLLLSATPMQLDPYELYSLIELVEPGLYPSFEGYDLRRRDLPRLNDLMRSFKGWGGLSQGEKAEIAERHKLLLKELGVASDEAVNLLDVEETRLALMDVLVTKHPLAGALVRNRKAELGGFAKREASSVLVEMTSQEHDLYWDVTAYLRDVYNKARAAKNHAVGFLMVMYQKMLTSSSQAIHSSLSKRLARLRAEAREAREAKTKLPTAEHLEELEDAEEASAAAAELEAAFVDIDTLEWEIEILAGLVDRLAHVRDTKASELVKLAKVIFDANPDEKILIFTQFIQTQEFLHRVLESQGYAVASFNGQMKLEAKEDAVARFRKDTQILISTEAGGEGRNFQFCHIMVNYDLPWNPMKVEQRIGRLDRIGQRRSVFIYNLAYEGTLEERVLEVLDKRIGLFVESVGSLDPILGELARDIEQIVMSQIERIDEVFEQFEEEVGKRVREARERERTLADFVLDRASFRRDVAGQLLGQAPLARFTDLQRFVQDVLAFYGGTLNEHPEGGEVISLSPRLASQLRIRQGVVRGIFDWKLALEMEDLDFFAFGHDLIDKITGLPMHSEPVPTGARRIPGSADVAVEVFYEIRAVGVRSSGRFIRHVVHEGLDVRSEQVDAIPSLGEEVTDADVPKWADEAIRASKKYFQDELSAESERLKTEDDDVKAEEFARAERIYRYREVRLKKLIQDQLAWIEERERGGSDRDKRILPARRGRLAKDKERLERLKFDFEEQTNQIKRREPGIAAEVLAAGLVLP